MSQNENKGNLTLKKDALSFKDVVIYGVVFMVPLAPITVFGEVAKASGNLVPLVYLVACIAMTFTGLSYFHFSKEFPLSGSVYAYISKGINPFVGFMGGWLILMDYFFIPALIYKTGGIYISDLVGGPWWIWCLIMIACVTFLNLRGIDSMSKVDWACLIAQCFIIVLLVILGGKYLLDGGGYGGFSIDPIYKSGEITLSFIATACALACLSFLGFDGISTLAEETIKPEKTIGKAIIASIVIIGIIFILETYMLELCWGDKDPSSFDDAMGFFQVVNLFAPKWFYTAFQIIWIVAVFVNVLVAQASGSRIVFGMARDKTLPHGLAKISPKTQAPVTATLLMCIVSVVVIFIPFTTIILLVNMGAILSFISLDIAVVYYFFIKKKMRNSVKEWIMYLICPIIGAVILGFIVTGFSTVTYTVAAIWVVIGFVMLAVRTKGFKVAPGQIEM